MKHYDYLVVGGGVSGMTAALLMALHGGKVLVVEKAPRLGGSLSRFRRKGVPFDVGFHFTGGLNADGSGMMNDMLQVLGLKDDITPILPPADKNFRVVFPSLNAVYDLPVGVEANKNYLKAAFPAEKQGIDAYFDRVLEVCRNTASMNVLRLGEIGEPLLEEHTTLQQALDEMVRDRRLQALFSLGCMCYGSSPSEVSFAQHCRMVMGLHECTARVKEGGDAFVRAFSRVFAENGVEVRCQTEVVELADIHERKVGRFILSDGSEVSAGASVLTIHPRQILGLMPRSHVTPAFVKRIEEFQPSVGFFSLFGVVEGDAASDLEDGTIFSVLPDVDINRMLTPGAEPPLPLVVIGSTETVAGRTVRTATIFEVASAVQVERWAGTEAGKRGDDYIQYKQRRAADLQNRLKQHHPWFMNNFKPLASGSMLTFRDYLHSPDGSAYGIRQKAGQFNVVGKLPLLNLYAAGQSAVLPGVMGSMASSFFVVRNILGKSTFQPFIEGRICR